MLEGTEIARGQGIRTAPGTPEQHLVAITHGMTLGVPGEKMTWRLVDYGAIRMVHAAYSGGGSGWLAPD